MVLGPGLPLQYVKYARPGDAQCKASLLVPVAELVRVRAAETLDAPQRVVKATPIRVRIAPILVDVVVLVRTGSSEEPVLDPGDPRDFGWHAVFFTLSAATAMQQQW